MRTLFIQLLLPIATYFIGVFVGVFVGKKIVEKNTVVVVENTGVEEDVVQIAHVGYTPEQMGYDK